MVVELKLLLKPLRWRALRPPALLRKESIRAYTREESVYACVCVSVGVIFLVYVNGWLHKQRAIASRPWVVLTNIVTDRAQRAGVIFVVVVGVLTCIDKDGKAQRPRAGERR